MNRQHWKQTCTGVGEKPGQTLEIKRVNNLRHEKKPPETVKSPGKVKVPELLVAAS